MSVERDGEERECLWRGWVRRGEEREVRRGRVRRGR